MEHVIFHVETYTAILCRVPAGSHLTTDRLDLHSPLPAMPTPSLDSHNTRLKYAHSDMMTVHSTQHTAHSYMSYVPALGIYIGTAIQPVGPVNTESSVQELPEPVA